MSPEGLALEGKVMSLIYLPTEASGQARQLELGQSASGRGRCWWWTGLHPRLM